LRAQRANGVHFRRRAAAKGYAWADLSLTGEEDTDTRPLANRMGAKSTSATNFMKKKCGHIFWR